MKNITIFLTALLALAWPASAAVDWESKGMQMAGEVVANPAAFLYDFQQDLEGTTPLPPGKTFSVQTGLFPTLIPLTNLNLSGKYRLHGEGRMAPGLPQLDLIGGYNDVYAARMVARNSDSLEDAKLYGYYVGAILSASVSPKIRTFWGYKRSALRAKFQFAPGEELELMNTKIGNIDTGFKDDFLMAGIETPKGVRKFWSIQLNYGVATQTFATKVSWYGPHFELGLNFYPEGVLVFHPVWNFHVDF